MNPDLWLKKFYKNEVFSGNFEHLKQLVSRLELFPEQSQIITVAGTNGKGQTIRLLNRILVGHQKRCLLWTSPHLFSVVERFQLNSQNIDARELSEIFLLLEKKLNELNVRISYFEFLFLSFLMWAKTVKPDYLLLEVGLGGRLDAVNTLDADYCLLTSIGRDHQDILGHRLEEILAQKVGVFRKKTYVISSLELDYLRKKTGQHAQKVSCEWQDLFDLGLLSKSDHFSKRNFLLAKYLAEKILKQPLNGLDFKDFMSARYTAKLQGVNIVFFPSHNIDGLRKLVQFLKQAKYTNDISLLVSFSDRSASELRVMMKILLKNFKRNKIWLYQYSHFKAISEEKLTAIANENKLKVVNDKTLFELFKEEEKELLVTGSNYFLSQFDVSLQRIGRR